MPADPKALEALERVEDIVADLQERFHVSDEFDAHLALIRTALAEGAEAVEVLRALGFARAAFKAETTKTQMDAFESGDEGGDWRDYQGDPRAKWDAYVRALADCLANGGGT